MSVRLKIILAICALVVISVVQVGFFAIQSSRLDHLIHEEENTVFASSRDAQNMGNHVSDESASKHKGHLEELLGIVADNTDEIVVALICDLLAAMLVSFLLIRAIVPPLNNAITITNAISIGYLENTIDTNGMGETGDLLRALAAMQRSLVEINDHLQRQVRETEVAYFDIEQRSAELKEAHQSLADLNSSMSTILDALDQGLFLFGSDGLCSNVSSKACLTLLESCPTGQAVHELLKSSPEEKESFESLLKLIFSDASLALDLDELLIMFPQTYAHSNGTKISLSYHPIADAEGLKAILGVATDRTAEQEAMQLMHNREAEALRILRISGNRNLFTQFYRSLVAFFSDFDQSFSDLVPLERMRRDIHTFKGNASLFNLADIIKVLHEIENCLEEVESPHVAREKIKILLPKLHAVLTTTHKQAYDVLGKNFDQQGIIRTIPVSRLHIMAGRIRTFPGTDKLYQDFVEELLGEPIRKPLAAFDIGIQELADRYGKKINPCYYTGDNFLLLTENYENLFASFSHIARNIIGHAIEPAEVRRSLGKDPELTVIIDTKKYKIEEQEWFCLSFEDDGCGLDRGLLRRKMSERLTENVVAGMSDGDVMKCIFEDNLSTKQFVDELSGRGVGLSAVKEQVERLGGHIAVESEQGAFTKIILDVPLVW